MNEKPGSQWDSNARPFDNKVYVLPLCYNICTMKHSIWKNAWKQEQNATKENIRLFRLVGQVDIVQVPKPLGIRISNPLYATILAWSLWFRTLGGFFNGSFSSVTSNLYTQAPSSFYLSSMIPYQDVDDLVSFWYKENLNFGKVLTHQKNVSINRGSLRWVTTVTWSSQTLRGLMQKMALHLFRKF